MASRIYILVPKQEAEEKIKARLEKGRELLGTTIDSPAQLESLKTEANKWSDYNDDLLKGILSESVYSHSVIGVPAQYTPLKQRTLPAREARIKREIARNVQSLESILDRLELFEELPENEDMEAMSVQPTSDNVPLVDKATLAELKHPQKVTLGWVIHNVDLSVWLWFGGALAVAFSIGLAAGQTTFFQEITGRGKIPTVKASATPTPTPEELEDLPASELKLSPFHMDTSKGYLEYGIHNNTNWTIRELILDFTLFNEDNKTPAVKNKYRLGLAPNSTGEPFKPSKYRVELGFNLDGNHNNKLVGIVGARGIKSQ